METQVAIMEQYQKEAVSLEVKAFALPVENDEHAVVASDTVVELKGALKSFEDFFKPIVDTTFTAHRTATQRRNLVCDPIKKAIRNLSDRVAAHQWRQQQERERKLQATRDEAARKEKIKQDALLEKAAKADEKGDTEKAEELVEKAEEVYVAPKPVAAPVKTNTSVRIIYDIEVTNKLKVPLTYTLVDEQRLLRIKRADKAFECPGVKFHPRAVGSTRSGK